MLHNRLYVSGLLLGPGAVVIRRKLLLCTKGIVSAARFVVSRAVCRTCGTCECMAASSADLGAQTTLGIRCMYCCCHLPDRRLRLAQHCLTLSPVSAWHVFSNALLTMSSEEGHCPSWMPVSAWLNFSNALLNTLSKERPSLQCCCSYSWCQDEAHSITTARSILAVKVIDRQCI